MKLWLRKIIISFLIHLEETGVKTGRFSRSTLKNYYKPIHRFCTKHEIELPWNRVTEGLGRIRSIANDRAPTLDEIASLLKNPDRRIRPIVLIMLSSGIRVGAFQYLYWKHIIPLDINRHETNDPEKIVAAKLVVYAGEDESYLSFITPEAYSATKEWMDYRAKTGEKVTGDSSVVRDYTSIKHRQRTTKSPKRLRGESIDELDNMPKQFQEKLLNFMDSGRIDVEQQKKQYHFEIKGAKVFATCNEIKRLGKPLQSRFRKLFLPRYTEQQFIEVSVKVLPKIGENMARYIGFTVFKNGGDIRDVMSVGKLIRKADGPQEVEWIINTMTKYGAKSENAILDLFEEFLFKMPRLYYGPF